MVLGVFSPGIRINDVTRVCQGAYAGLVGYPVREAGMRAARKAGKTKMRMAGARIRTRTRASGWWAWMFRVWVWSIEVEVVVGDETNSTQVRFATGVLRRRKISSISFRESQIERRSVVRLWKQMWGLDILPLYISQILLAWQSVFCNWAISVYDRALERLKRQWRQ